MKASNGSWNRGLLLSVWALACTGSSPDRSTESGPANETGSRDSASGVDNETGIVEDSGHPIPDEPVELLGNGSFEDGDNGWNIWGGAQLVEDAAVDGSWALMATNGNGAEQLVEGLEPDATYRLSGWGMTEGTSPMTIGVKFYGGDQTLVQFTTNDYTEDSLVFTTGFGNTSAVVFAYKHSGEEAGYVDGLSLFYESASGSVLVWSDEFDGTGELDPALWGYETGFVRNEELQWYQEDNAVREDGFLVIEGRTEDRPNPDYIPGSSSWKTNRETIEYTASSITTEDRFEWQYGHLVVRAKVTNFMGTWPAIWTLGTECEWPSNGEVDVMENYGGNILANFAWGTDTRWSPNWDSSHWPVEDMGEGWVDAFHIWELDWTEDAMTILLDGTILNTVDLNDTVNGSAACAGQNPFRQPHYLLLNLALGGSAGGSVDELSFPTRYVVDYVRWYQ